MQNTEHHCHLKGTISLVHAIKDDWWCNSYAMIQLQKLDLNHSNGQVELPQFICT